MLEAQPLQPSAFRGGKPLPQGAEAHPCRKGGADASLFIVRYSFAQAGRRGRRPEETRSFQIPQEESGIGLRKFPKSGIVRDCGKHLVKRTLRVPQLLTHAHLNLMLDCRLIYLEPSVHLL